MSSYYHYQQHPTPTTAASVQHAHHGGRNRRAPRLSVSQSNNNVSQKQFRGVRSMKELSDSTNVSAYRMRFEATRSFDLEDDMEFCPGLLTESDRSSIASSERSSLASLSPESSPTQQPTTIAPPFSLNSSSPSFLPPGFQGQQSSMMVHAPTATRARGNAIPIINPTTGITMASPPPSVSPSRMHQQKQHTQGRRWQHIGGLQF